MNRIKLLSNTQDVIKMMKLKSTGEGKFGPFSRASTKRKQRIGSRITSAWLPFSWFPPSSLWCLQLRNFPRWRSFKWDSQLAQMSI